ncbi:MAG TPA: ABC transporter ATP-binding protein [Tenuifilaceae bacterium]|nr:ABC transporter ATP-binding protein [Tenuifilaceae bacterium]HPE18687.1 ABC transporter ATP-binding protein [Tenuifilaceae bacterium]HPJ45540.1 ABC transporter ATP-binding protein [Tenuifilaceae bacterium]HPQ33806.1 ABC transporter ATP-binding protein [Tenuifilaceae bacterium]HRX68618.1 ABC transporter ATP-binding protein [Tenuifilaceae bacterium]
MSMQINGLNKSFGEISLYRDFSISFSEGTISCILGPSGCGKTTLLNIIGKTQSFESGQLVGFDSKIISYIFQDPRLLPWKTVEENVDFVLSHDLPFGARKKTVNRFLRLVELDRFANYYPSQLSGGMRQRVSIARAFAFPSDLILMDEPLKGLDIKLKLNLIKAFAHIWDEDKRTVVFVTHDVEEALLLGNEIFVLSQPPVTTKMQRVVDTPILERSLNSPESKAIKEILINTLGE